MPVKERTNNTIQAAWVALGSLFSMSFGIVSAIILSRYLSISEYGLYKQVLYVYTTLNGFFVLGLPKAYSYFLPKTPNSQAKSLINKINYIFFILGAILTAVLYFCAPLIDNLLNAPGLENLLRIFSPVPLFMMPTLGLESILATYRKTCFISIYVIMTRSVMLLCICVPVITFDCGCQGAIYGFVISSFVSFLIAMRLKFYPVKNAGNDKTVESYKSIFKFCVPLAVASIWGILINSTDQFFISRYFGNEEFAIFSNGSMELPFVGVIIGATSTVLTPLFTRYFHEKANIKETIIPVWKNAFSKSIMLIYPLTLFCIFDAERIMICLYGDIYAASSPFFQIKLITYFFKVIVFYSLIIALGAVNFYQKLHMILFFILVALEYISVLLFEDPLLITAIHVLITIVTSIALMIFIANALNISVVLLIPKRLIIKVSLASVISCLFFTVLKYKFYSEESTIIQLILDGILMLCMFGSLSYILKINYWNILKPLIKKK